MTGPTNRPPVARDVPGVAEAERDWSRGSRILLAAVVFGVFLGAVVVVLLLLGAVSTAVLVVLLPLSVYVVFGGIALVVLRHESRALSRLLATQPWREMPLFAIPPARKGARPQLVLGEHAGRGSRATLRRMTSGTGLRSGHRLDALEACAGHGVWICGDARLVVVSPAGGRSLVLARLVRLPDAIPPQG